MFSRRVFLGSAAAAPFDPANRQGWRAPTGSTSGCGITSRTGTGTRPCITDESECAAGSGYFGWREQISEKGTRSEPVAYAEDRPERHRVIGKPVLFAHISLRVIYPQCLEAHIEAPVLRDVVPGAGLHCRGEF